MKYDFHKKGFIEQEITPEKIAIAGSDKDISWNMLKSKVETLYNEFKKHNIPAGHPIIIHGHKEHLFPVAILACMHAGLTYVPIDKIYPLDRIKKISEKTGAQIIINCSSDILELEFAITINSGLESNINYIPDYSNKTYNVDGDLLQYIMFTSGSTGEPKGVQIARKSVLKFLDWAIKDFSFDPSDVFMNQAPFTFDVSLCDILNAFARGGTLVLNSSEVLKDQQKFIERIAKYNCTIWTSTPSFAFLFLRHPNFNKNILSSLSTFLFMGEELPGRTCSILKTNFDTAKILNAYGPTEATIVTTLVEITEDVIKGSSKNQIVNK